MKLMLFSKYRGRSISTSSETKQNHFPLRMKKIPLKILKRKFLPWSYDRVYLLLIGEQCPCSGRRRVAFPHRIPISWKENREKLYFLESCIWNSSSFIYYAWGNINFLAACLVNVEIAYSCLIVQIVEGLKQCVSAIELILFPCNLLTNK